MDEIKKIHKQFLITIFLFVFAILIISTGVTLAYIYLEDINIQYIIFLSLLVLLLFITSVFRTKIDYIINMSYLAKISNNQGEPFKINRLYSKENLHTYLGANNFEMFSNEPNYLIYYKASKDHIKKILRGYILEIIVYLSPDQKEFYYDEIDEDVHEIQKKLSQDRIRVDKLLITQIKVVDELDDLTKQKLSEIVFLRSQAGIISTINVGLHLESNKAVMLYSDTFTPSLFYTYHIEQIKKLV